MNTIAKIILSSAEQSNCTWCILRKEDEILRGIDNDIDLYVNARQWSEFIDALKATAQQNDILIARERRMPAGTSFLFVSKSDPRVNKKVDIVHENTIGFISILPSKRLEDSIIKGIQYPVLKPDCAHYLSVAKEELRKKPLEFLRTKITTAKRTLQPPKTFLLGYLRALIFNHQHNPGAFVVLVGPDGSGKTTIAEKLAIEAKSEFFSSSVQHFSIPTLPRIADILRRKKSTPDYTKPDSGTHAPIQPKWRALIYTAYYGAELIIYSYLRLARRLRQGQLVVFDRYFHDWLFQRSHRRAPKPAIKMLLNMAITPDLVVYLNGDAEKINKRKPELSATEIRSQQKIIEEELMSFWKKKTKTLELDSTKLTTQEIVKTIRLQLT